MRRNYYTIHKNKKPKKIKYYKKVNSLKHKFKVINNAQASILTMMGIVKANSILCSRLDIASKAIQMSINAIETAAVISKVFKDETKPI